MCIQKEFIQDVFTQIHHSEHSLYHIQHSYSINIIGSISSMKSIRLVLAKQHPFHFSIK